MNLSAQFKQFLLSQSSPASKVTVKNYVSDVNKFIKWFEAKFNRSFSPSEISESTIANFKAESLTNYSASSVDRNISSLRKFFTYLKLEEQISHSPFEQRAETAEEALAKEDPWRVKDFKNYLYVFNASHLTIKNYIIDLKQFITWAEEVLKSDSSWEVNENNLLDEVDSSLINEYKKRLLTEAKLSPVSVNRKLSSLRRYFSWAEEEGIIKSDVQVLNESSTNPLLNAANIAELATPIPASAPLDKSLSIFPPLRLLQKFSGASTAILDGIMILPLVSLAHKAEYGLWILKGKPVIEAKSAGLLTRVLTSQAQSGVKIKNVGKEFYAPAKVSTRFFPFHKKVLFHAKHTRPDWYKKYQNTSFIRFAQLAILAILFSALSYALYSNLGPNKNQTKSLAALPTAPPRILSFQGRLTDSTDNPITSPTALRMAIYDTSSASGSSLLWQEIVTVSPDSDGIFATLLGNNTTIPQSVFAQNSALYLGVTVGMTPELSPRQQIATVAFATNSETLQGLEPITNSASTSNVVLALNSSGNLSIGGSAAPVFQSTGGSFTVQGTTLILSTVTASGGNVRIAPDGLGKIDLQKPLQNNTITNNLSTARGAVEVDDLFAILATSSGQSAFTLNQDSTGPLISASTSGVAKFTVDNGGNLTAAGTLNGLTVSNGTISSGTWNGTAISSTYGGTGINTSASTGVPYISGGTWSVDANALAANHGGTSFTTYAQGDTIYASAANTLSKLTIGGNGTCLTSNGTIPGWGSCATGTSLSPFQQGAGFIFPNNSTVDFLLGGQATTSAKFAITNIAAALSPIASLSATTTSGGSGNGLVLSAAGSIQSLRNNTLTIGGDTTGNIIINSKNNTGKISINTTSVASLAINMGGTYTTTADSQNVNTYSGVTLNAPNNDIRINSFGGSVNPSGAAGNTFRGNLFLPNLTNSNDNVSTFSVIDSRVDLALSYTGIVSNGIAFRALAPSITGGTGAFTNYYGLQVAAFGSAATNSAGIQINDGTSSGNNTDLLIGTSAIPTGNFGIYNTSANDNFIRGQLGLGIITPTSQLTVTRALSAGVTGNALAIFNQIEQQDIFTASASGTPIFTVTRAGGIALGTNGLSFGTSSQCLLGGAPATWGSCTTGTSLSPFQQGAGFIFPNNSTVDFLLGGQATTSAKFAITNIAAALSPIATLSATTTSGGTGNGLVFNSTGSIQGLRNNSLTIGGDTTGNITLSPLNGGTGSILTVNALNQTWSATSLTASSLATFTSAPSLGITATTLTLGNGSAATIATTTNGLTLDSGSNTITFAATDTNFTASGIATIDWASAVTIDSATLTIGGGSSSTIATSSNGNLALAANTTTSGTGQILLTADYNTGVQINTAVSATPLAPLYINGGIGNNAALIVNNINNGNLITASASGTTKFTVDTNGAISAATTSNTINSLIINAGALSGITGYTQSTGAFAFSGAGNFSVDSAAFDVTTGGAISGVTTLAMGGALSGATTIGASGVVTFSNAAYTGNNAVIYGTSGTGVLAAATSSTANQCLVSNAGGSNIPGWSSCAAGTSQSLWRISSGALSPINDTLDVLIGSNATTSAKFAITNIAAALSPIATLSATTTSGGSGSGLVFNSTGSIQSLIGRTLSLGGTTTGNVQLLSKAGSAFTTFDTVNSRVGIGTDAPTALLHVITANETTGTNKLIALFEHPSTNDGGSGYIQVKGGANSSDFEQNSAGSGPFRYGDYVDTNIINNDFGETTNGPYGNINFITNQTNVMQIGGGSQAGSVRIGGTHTQLASTKWINSTLDVQPNIFNGGTTPILFSSGSSSSVALGTDNSGSGDLFTASASGTTKFTINNSGEIGSGIQPVSGRQAYIYKNAGNVSSGTYNSVYGLTQVIPTSAVFSGSIVGVTGRAEVHANATQNVTGSIVGISAEINNGDTGTTTVARGLQIASLANSGTITDTYGLYIGDLTTGTQTNTPFSIYSSDSGTYNYFAGNVGIGDLSPASAFTVGAGDLFQVNSSGAITAATGFTEASGAFAFSGAGNFSVDSAAFDVTTGGAVSGVTTLAMGGALSGATTIGASGVITFSNAAYTGNNAVIYGTSGTGVLAAATSSTANQCLVSNAGGSNIPGWSSCAAGTGTNWWTTSSDGKALTPINSTMDFILGGQATTSAKFAFTGLALANSQTQATISGNLVLYPNNGFGGNAQIFGSSQTTPSLADSGNKGATLSLNSTTNAAGSGGTITFSSLNDNGNYTPQAAIKSLLSNGSTNGIGDLAFSTRNAISDTSLTERLRIAATGNIGIGGDTTPDSLFSVGSTSQFQVNSSGAIAAVTGFTEASGAFAFSGAGNFSVDSAAFDVTTGGAVSGVTTLSASGAVTLSNYNANNNILYATVTTGLVAGASTNTTGQCLLSGASAPAWSTCPGGSSDWTRTAGNIYPTVLNDTIAATSAASTVATFTTNNPAGTLTNNTLIQHTGAGTVTNLLNLTRSAGTATNALTFTGTFTKLINSTNFNVTNAGAVTAVGVDSGSGQIQGTGGLSVSGSTTLAGTAGNTVTIGNTTGAMTLTSGGTSAWTNTSGNLTIQTATSGTLALDSAASLTVGATSATGLTLGRSGVTTTFGSTSWTATPTISGLITATSGVTSNGTVAVNASGGITTNQTSFPIVNTGATTVNLAGGATTQLSLGSSTVNTVNVPSLSVSSAVYTDGSKNLTSTAPSTGTIGYWSRSAQGALTPATLNDVVAATSSAYTPFTATTNNPAGTLANNTLIQQTGAGTVTNLLNLTQSAGTATNGLTFTGTFTKLINSTNFNVTNAGGVTAVGASSFSTTAGVTTGIGNTTGALTLTSGGTSAWTNTSGNLTIQTATSGTMAVDSAGALNLGITNSTSTSLGKAATTLTVNPTSWTATPTISGLITATSGLSSNGNVKGTAEDTYFSWDFSTNRIGFTKKTGSVGKATYGSANSFAIAQSNATGIDAANTFTDRFVIDSSGNVSVSTGTFTSAGLITASGGVTLAANQNFVMNSGTGTFTQNSTSTGGGDFSIINTGVAAGAVTIAAITANSATTADILTISGTGLTTGSGLVIAGSTTATGATDSLLKLSGRVGGSFSAGLISSSATFTTNTAVSNANLYLNTTNSNTTNADTAYGIYNTMSDSTTLANTLYGNYTNLSLSGNAAKTATGNYINISSSSTTSDNLYGLRVISTNTGAINASGFRNYGISTEPQLSGASTGGSSWLFGLSSTPTLNSATNGSDTLIAALYAQSSATLAVGSTATVSQYGLLIDGQTASTNGVSNLYGIYVNNQTGADTNYQLYMEGGNSFMSATGSNTISIGTAFTGTGLVNVTGASKGQALLVLNETGNQNIIAASASGTTKFTVDRTGNVVASGDVSGSSLTAVTVNISGWDIDQDASCAGSGRLCFERSGTPLVSFTSSGQGRFTAGTTTGTPDVAENINVLDGSIEAGDIVSSVIYDSTEKDIYYKAVANKTATAYDPKMVGAISENPGVLLGARTPMNQAATMDTERMMTIAGRIPLKVSTINGDIHTGDAITSSNIPGVGMKATEAGRTLGIAMMDYINPDPNQVGKILVFISPAWHDPDVRLTNSGELNIAPSVDYNFEIRRNGENFTRIGGYSELVAASIRGGLADFQSITTQTFTGITSSFQNITTNSLAIATSNITIAGQSIQDFIANIVDQRIAQNPGNGSIISPLETDGDNISLKLKTNDDKSKFVVKNASGSAVATIDGSGNASLSGQLTAANASISGTIRADRIIANNIEGLNIQASTVSANYITNNYYISTPSGQTATPSGFFNQSATGSAMFGDLTAQTATFTQGLMSFGPTSFFEASIADRLFVGSQLSLADNSINVLGSELKIQPLRQGDVSFMAGLVKIDTDGNLNVAGNSYFAKNVEVKGKLAANIIAPLQGKDLIFEFNQQSGSNPSSKVQFKTGTESAVLSINNKGDINASGAGTFAKLNLDIVKQVQAVSDTEIIATGSAGMSEIKANKEEMTINNKLITEDSLIYITPKTSIPNESIYLIRQVPGESFTVGISNPINKKVQFNWIIIN